MTITEMQVADIDLFALGQAALKLPLIATQLGHRSLDGVGCYTHPTTLEARFTADLLSLAAKRMTLAEFNAEWFGGDDGARELLRLALDADHMGASA